MVHGVIIRIASTAERRPAVSADTAPRTTVRTPTLPAHGAAMFAAMAAGIYTNIQETYDHMGIHDFTVYKPDEIHRAAYEEIYRKNKHLRNMLRGVSAEGLNLEVNS